MKSSALPSTEPATPEPVKPFGEAHAAIYDKQAEKLAPMRDNLHLLMRLIFSDLPTDTRILCVGAGTGAELLYLAQTFPGWHFTAVDPAAPMLAICRRKAEAAGIAARCTFHEGYLDSLPASPPFNAATSLLVSQFLLQREERRRFFQQIAERLQPGGYLVTSDLASDMASTAYRDLLEVWTAMLQHSGASPEQAKNNRAAHGRDVALLPPNEVAAIITAGGFERPVLFFQSLLIHAWYARRAVQE